MRAATLDCSKPAGEGELCDLSPEHFAAAERVTSRRCLELPVVCEVWLSKRDRALVMPWMLCELTPSRQLGIPRLTAPDVIAAASLEPASLVEIRREMTWLRLIDLLCGTSLPHRETVAMLDAFCALHGLPSPIPAALIARRRLWLASGHGVETLIGLAIKRFSEEPLAQAFESEAVHV